MKDNLCIPLIFIFTFVTLVFDNAGTIWNVSWILHCFKIPSLIVCE